MKQGRTKGAKQMNVTITCPACNQSLEANSDMNGMEVECPSCNTPFTIQTEKVAPPEISQTREMKECPYCGEDILAKAKKCKHCGEFLDESMRPATVQSQPAPVKKTNIPEKMLWEGHTAHMYFLGDHILWGILGCLTLVGFLGNFICYMKAKSMKYKLTNKRISSAQGILSKKTAEVMVRDVRSVNLKQGICERIFGLGNVEIGSAGTAGIEVTLAGIAQAPKVKEQITRLQNEVK